MPAMLAFVIVTAGRGMEQIFSGAYDDKGKKLK